MVYTYKHTIMQRERSADELAGLAKALADPNRVRLVELLRRRGLCVTAAAQELGLSQPLVSQHLRVLRQAGLIRGERLGRRVHYRLDLERWEALLGQLRGLVGEAAAKKEGLKVS